MRVWSAAPGRSPADVVVVGFEVPVGEHDGWGWSLVRVCTVGIDWNVWRVRTVWTVSVPTETGTRSQERLTRLFINRMDENQELFVKFMEDDQFKELVTEILCQDVYEEHQDNEE